MSSFPILKPLSFFLPYDTDSQYNVVIASIDVVIASIIVSLREKVFNTLPLGIEITYVVFRKFPSILLRVFIMNRCWILRNLLVYP